MLFTMWEYAKIILFFKPTRTFVLPQKMMTSDKQCNFEIFNQCKNRSIKFNQYTAELPAFYVCKQATWSFNHQWYSFNYTSMYTAKCEYPDMSPNIGEYLFYLTIIVLQNVSGDA